MTTEERITEIQARHDEDWAVGGAVTARQSEVDRGVLLDIVRDLTAERDRLRAALREIDGGMCDFGSEMGGDCYTCTRCIARRALAGEAT